MQKKFQKGVASLVLGMGGVIQAVGSEQKPMVKSQKTTQASKKAQPKDAKDFHLEVHEHDFGLPNKAYFIPSDKPLVCISVMFKGAGRQVINKTHPSLPQFLGTMFSRGAGPYNDRQLQEKIYDCGASFNVSMGMENLFFDLWVPAPFYKEALELGILMLLKPKFPRHYFEQMRKSNIISFEERLKHPEAHLLEACNAASYPDDFVYRCSLKAVGEDLKTIKVKALREYMKFLLQQNAVMVVLGPREQEEEIMQEVKKIFLRLPAEPRVAIPTFEKAPSPRPQHVHVEFDIPQSMVGVRLPGFGVDDPLYLQKSLALYLVAGGSLNAMLFQEIREKRGLAYYCSGQKMLAPLDPHISICLGTKNETRDKALEALREVLENVRKKGISKEDFARAQQELAGGMVVGCDSVQQIVGFIISGLARGWHLERVLNQTKLLNQITYEEVNQVAKNLFHLDQGIIVDVGKQGTASTVTEVSYAQ